MELALYGLIVVLALVLGLPFLVLLKRATVRPYAIVAAVAAVSVIAVANSSPNLWDALLCLAIGGLAISLFAIGARRARVSVRPLFFGGIAMFIVSAAVRPPQNDEHLERYAPRRARRENFVSSDTCRSCHPGHYASWHRTFHRTMTQYAVPQTVRAPFDGITLSNRDRTYLLQRRGDEFWVTMPDADWEQARQLEGYDLNLIADPPRVDRRILLTTGSHHVQAYWVRGDRGRELQLLPFYYHLQDNRWIPTEDTLLRPPETPRGFEDWNTVCLRCHTTGGRPGLQERSLEAWANRTATFDTEVVEFGISCEACHGPAEDHVRFHQNPINRYQQHFAAVADPTIVNPRRCSSRTSSEICGQCHSYFVARDLPGLLANGLSYRAGENLDRSHRIIRFEEGDQRHKDVDTVYWSDGACRVGGDEYNGLIESPCYQQGALSCLSCHSMHQSSPDDQLAERMETNHACTQCHSGPEFTSRMEEHTHHPAASSGSLCYNCHMPHTSYALFTAMRSHRVDSPTVTSGSEQNARPNACNLCHLDRTLDWTADRLFDWYGQPRINVAEDEQQVAASLLWLLRGDAVQRTIVAWHMGWDAAHQAAGDDWQAPFLAFALEDSYSVNRYVAHRALKNLPGFDGFEYDFVGSEDHRRAAKQRALRTWESRETKSRRNTQSSILIDFDRRLQHETVQRLIEQRDHRPVTIPE